MKKYPLLYLPKAQEDTIRIFEYIQRDAPARAKPWIEKVDHALGRLASFPESGAVPKDKRLAALGYRMVVLGEYLAFYVFQGDTMEIRRVLHGKRRYRFLF